VAESARANDTPLRYRDQRESPESTKVLAMSARASVVPETADDSAEEIGEVGRDSSLERAACILCP